LVWKKLDNEPIFYENEPVNMNDKFGFLKKLFIRINDILI